MQRAGAPLWDSDKARAHDCDVAAAPEALLDQVRGAAPGRDGLGCRAL